MEFPVDDDDINELIVGCDPKLRYVDYLFVMDVIQQEY